MALRNKQFTVIVSDEAAQMLMEHVRFLVQVSEEAARRLVMEFNVKIRSLEEFPERNPWLIDPMIPSRKYRKLLLAKHYLLVYEIGDTHVFVDAVVDCRQDYAWLL